MDNQDYYNTPELSQAQQASDSASSTATNYASAASLLPQKLREAVMAKVDYNKDIIEQKNKAQSEYFAAPSAARAKYNDPTSENYIFNPFQAEKLVAGERAQAYQPYANLTDILGQRTGSLADIINAGTGAFQSSVTASQGAADRMRQKYSDLFTMAQAKTGQKNVENQLALDTYKAKKPSSSGGGDGVGGLESIMALMGLLGNVPGASSTTEPQPNYSPTKGIGSLSQGGLWLYSDKGWEPRYELVQ